LIEARSEVFKPRAQLKRTEEARDILYKVARGPFGRPSIIAPNKLQREFTVDEPDQAWVTDIICIRTWQGWLYLAVVMDLFARKVVGWSMKPTLAREIVLDALLMAVWRRKPQQPVIVHSDSENVMAGSVWWSDQYDVRHYRASGAGRPRVA
jgi:transposase InsO family protein